MGVEFGHFEILRKLATGGMAELFLARQKSVGGFQRNVVVKKILPEYSDDPSFVESFLNEARLAAQLNHPNIVQIYDLGLSGKSYFIAMEYIQGFDLSTVLRLQRRDKQLIPVDVALTFARDMVAALDYAHNAKDLDAMPLGIVHRDVTPSNVIVSVDGQAKMVDFGIAKATAQAEGRTRTGTVKGKASYLSPEQVLGHAIDRRVDVFACAIVTYEMLSLRNPFRGDNDYTTLRNVVEMTPPLVTTLRPDVPQSVAELLRDALYSSPDKRIASCGEFLARLEVCARDAGLLLSHSVTRAFIAERNDAMTELRRGDVDELDLTGSEVLSSGGDPSTAQHDMSSVIAQAQGQGGVGWRTVAILGALAFAVVAVLLVALLKKDAPAPVAPVATAVVDPPRVVETPASVPATAPSALPSSATADAKAPVAESRVAVVKKGAAARPSPAKAAVAGPPGRVRFSVQPWAEVELDGDVVGVTPMRTLDVPSGNHKIVLRNSELSKTVRMTIEVLPGKELVVRHNLAH